MSKAYLLLGGNIGNTQDLFKQAIQRIEEKCGATVQQSPIYRTAPWGLQSDQEFLNQCIEISTELLPFDLLSQLQAIEVKLGRQKDDEGPRWQDRVIDIDILLYDSISIESETLTIPHRWLSQRRFALVPLADIAADYIHPVWGARISELLTKCPDKLAVNPLPA